MNYRILPEDEYDRLEGTELGDALQSLPDEIRVIVVEREGVVAGCLAMVPLWHAEGFYVAPEFRGRGVDAELVAALHAEARDMGIETVFPAAASSQMAHYVTRLGAVEIPARWFALAVKES